MAAPLAPAGPLPDVVVAAPATFGDWLVVLPLVIPLATGALLVMLRHRIRLHGPIAAIGLVALLAADLGLLSRVLTDGPVVMAMGAWKPPFGIAFEADLLGVTFASVAALVALAVAAYSGPTINAHEQRYGFHPFLMLLMTGVTGAFLTGDLFNLYVWFEVMLIASFGLLVLGSREAQIDAAVKYGVLNLLATTLFLIATGLLYGVLGTLNMADLAIKARAVAPDAPMTTITALFLLAFAAKAAAFPANFWLPASYHTPGAGVSALFGALLTKVGVYALLKVMVLILAMQAARLDSVTAFVAGATMLVGALGALSSSDLRRLLGWVVIAGIGNMMVGVALAGEAALTGAIFYAVHSMLVTAGLYLAAGVAEEIAGTGDLRRLGGLYALEPRFAAAVLILAFAVAGLPPLSGFWPKAMLVEASLSAGAPGLAITTLVSGFLLTLALGRVFLFAFWRGGPEGTADGEIDLSDLTPLAADERLPRLAPVLLLAAVALGIGLYPAPLHGLAEGAARGLLDLPAFARPVLGGAP